jgi:hypothetical protein
MRLKEFLIREAKEKHAVFAFGRMNPPTTGHEVLVNKVKEIAKQHNATHHVVLSHTIDKAKNPLQAKQKLKHAQRFFPNTNLSVATSEHPTFLQQATKLHQKGVTHLHMVAGSDRVPEYERLLNKYNGTHKDALFNFKHIEVHSAGERDPDAEGAAGMSASKMRGHANEGNFKEFRKGIPAHVKNEHAKELYDELRKGMGVRENLENQIPVDNLFEQFIVEGVHDKSIFKAVFLSGGPGSGKDYVLDNTLSGHGLTELNSDKALEFLMDKKGLDKTMPPSEQEMRDVVRGKAKSVTELRQRLAILGRNGIIINGTGDDVDKIKKIKERLEEIGYDTHMVSVVTDDEISRQRNNERGQRGGRTVPEEIRKKKWDDVSAARPKFAEMFGNNYVEFDNSQDLRQAPPEVVKQKKDEMLNIFKRVKEFTSAPPSNPKAEEWIANELHKKDRMGVPKDKSLEKHAHPDSQSYEEAMQQGLEYYGFGRYGKNGEVTHHSVNDKLVPITKVKPPEPNIPTASSSGIKKVNEEFEQLFEAVSITISGDTVDEVKQAMKLLSSKEEETKTEEVSFSDDSARKLLSLGKVQEQVLTESKKETKEKYVTDQNGKVRVFMLRRGAAKEAHIKGGVVHKQGAGYVIKLKESEDVESINKSIQETRSQTGSFSGSSTGTRGRIEERRSCGTTQEQSCDCSGCQASGETKSKISITQAKKAFKQKIQEIDCGTEVGMSMSGGGENATRGSLSNSPKKKPLEELTGDETTMSIGDQKEDELKKQGISLSSFKAKKTV